MNTKIFKNLNRQAAYKALAATHVLALLVATMVPGLVNAAQLENRSLTLSSSVAGAENVTYTFQFDVTASSTEARFEFCENDPFPGETCTPASGLDVSGVQDADVTGDYQTVSSTTGDHDITVAGSGATGTVNVAIAGVTNPDTANQEYFVRVYDVTNGDDGGIAFSTAETIQVTARVQETLKFCVYAGGTCTSPEGFTADLGILNTSTIETAESHFDVATNARNGVVIQYLGDTLTSGTFSIDAFNGGDGNPAASSPNTEQFGLRIVSATTGGTANADIASPFDTMPSNEYAFLEGDYHTVGTSDGPVEDTTFVVEYGANVAALTATGVYTTQIEYIATATF